MPHNIRNQTIYAVTGDPDTVNESALYKAGELGGSLSKNKREYQLVQCDTGATAATGVGVVAATQLAFWKDRANYLVTNDLAQTAGAPESRNQVAGIFRVAVTAGRYCFILKRGQAISVLADSSTYVAGERAVANSGDNAAIIDVADGTALTHTLVGLVLGARAGGVVSVDVNIPEVE